MKLRKPQPRVERLRGLFSYTCARYLEDDYDLSGYWDVTFKIDGVRVVRGNDDVVYSRKGGKQLQHIQDTMPDWITDAELFQDNWSTSMSLKAGTLPVLKEHYYSLNPPDIRLAVGSDMLLTHEYCKTLMEWAMTLGYEGLVLRKVGTAVWLKVVPLRYADVRVTGFVEAGGNLVGHIASFTTRWGRVSCGSLTHNQRKWLWDNRVSTLNHIIQARYRERFAGGKLRFAQFDRWRDDKNTESI